MSTDNVPNVRFNVAKTFQRIGHIFEKGVASSQVKPVLEKLKDDADNDVKYFATEATAALGF